MQLRPYHFVALGVIAVVVCVYVIVRLQGAGIAGLPGFFGTAGVPSSTSTPHSVENPDLKALPPATAAQTKVEIARLETELASASDVETQASIQRRIADRTMSIDTAKAMHMLKTIATSSQYPAAERALAVEMMASVYLDRSDNSPLWAQRFVFTTSPFAEMLSTTSNRIATWNAVATLSEYAIAQSPLPISEYRLSLWSTRQGDYTAAKRHIDQGNALFDAFTATLESEDAYMIPKAYRIRAEAEQQFGRATRSASTTRAARASFETARSLAVGMQPQANAAAALELVWIDYRYALALVAVGSKTDYPLIEELVKELVANNRPYFQFNNYLKRMGSDRTAPQALLRETKEIELLGQIAPEFRGMLAKLGWN